MGQNSTLHRACIVCASGRHWAACTGRQMADPSPPALETSSTSVGTGGSDLMEACRGGWGGANPGLSLLPLARLQKHSVCVPGLRFSGFNSPVIIS